MGRKAAEKSGTMDSTRKTLLKSLASMGLSRDELEEIAATTIVVPEPRKIFIVELENGKPPLPPEAKRVLSSGRVVWMIGFNTLPSYLSGEEKADVDDLVWRGHTPLVIYKGTDYIMVPISRVPVAEPEAAH
jgi:hypothetical protein